MLGSRRVLVAALLFALAAGVVGGSSATADEPKPQSKGKGKKPDPQPTADSGKPIIIQLDASKLPPDVLKELLKLSRTTESSRPGKPDTKPETSKPGTKPDNKFAGKPAKAISLTDAIAIAEKATQGTVVKAEREDEDGAVQFKLQVLDGKGNKTKVTVAAGGKVILPEKKGEDEKPGKKKQEDDEKSKGKKKEEDEKGKGKKKDKDD